MSKWQPIAEYTSKRGHDAVFGWWSDCRPFGSGISWEMDRDNGGECATHFCYFEHPPIFEAAHIASKGVMT